MVLRLADRTAGWLERDEDAVGGGLQVDWIGDGILPSSHVRARAGNDPTANWLHAATHTQGRDW
jgi:hypothetical protein